MSPMQTSFTLTIEDFARFQKRVAMRLKRNASLSLRLFIAKLACWLFIGMAYTGLFRLIEQHPALSGSLKILGLFFGLALVAALVASPVQHVLLRKHMFLPDGAFLSRQTIRVSESALLIETERGRNELLWDRFLDAEQDDRNYYLLVDAMQAVIVPKASVEAFRPAFESRLSLVKNVA